MHTPRRPDRATAGPRHPVAMLTHSYYEEDPRVRREAEALVAAGRDVDVYSLRRPDDPPDGELAGVRIRRIDVQRHQGAGVATYVREYLAFLLRSGWAVSRAQRRRRYALVQVHTMPDFLAFAGLPLRVAGVPLLIDLHEAMPEFFPIRFPRAASPLARRMLRLQERMSIAVANHAITVNDALRDRLVALGIRPGKVSVVPNHPSLRRFDPGAAADRPFMADGTLRLVYAGAVTPVYELDVAIEAVAVLAARRPDLPISFDIYGRGDSEDALRALASARNLAERVTFHGRIPFEAVPAAIAAADIGMAPTRLDSYTLFSLSTKIFEYAAMRRPVVATRLPLVERTFGEGTVATYLAGDASGFADAIEGLIDRPEERAARIEVTRARVTELAWERTEADYLAVVEGLAADGISSAAAGAADPATPPRPDLEDA